MKTLRFLVTLLLVTLCTGFYSCDKELEVAPQESMNDENLLNKTDKVFAEYLKDYSNIKCRAYSKGESSVILSGIKNNHLWYSEFDATTKNERMTWEDIEETDTIQQLYKGYGEYETLHVKYAMLNYYKETSTGNIVTFDIGRRQTIFTSKKKSKRTQLHYDSTGIPNDWYSESIFIGDCCYSHEGDTIYITRETPKFNNGKIDAELISYEEGIRLSDNTISRYSYKETKSMWNTLITPPFDITPDVKRNYTLLDKITNVWEYKGEVIFYDGTKKDFTFKINIDNGKLVTDEIKVTGLSINSLTVEIKQGETFKLTATVQPENATNKRVTWISSNVSIASVNQDGLITANSTGETNITVTTEDGKFTATAIVTVTKNEGSEDDKITLANLKGTWDMTKCYGWEYNDKGVKEDWTEDVTGEYIFFEDVDGNGGYNNGYKTYYFASSINGNKLILRNSDWLDGKDVTITKLTSTELHITATDKVSEENYEMKRR